MRVKRFIFAPSAKVYGESLVSRKVETLPTNPASLYGVSKNAVEKYLKDFMKQTV
jgi:UDP-glucose 4-epimerase